MRCVGELDVVNAGKTLRLSTETLVPPPAHMSTTKISTIQEWIHGVQDDVVNTITDSLAGKTIIVTGGGGGIGGATCRRFAAAGAKVAVVDGGIVKLAVVQIGTGKVE